MLEHSPQRLERKGLPKKPLGRVRVLLSQAPRMQRHSVNDSQTLKSNGVCPAGFRNCFGPVNPVFLTLSPYGNGNVYPMNVPPLCIGSV